MTSSLDAGVKRQKTDRKTKILVLNCGSTTLEFQLIETIESDGTEQKLVWGIVDRSGGPASFHFDAN